mmetsp:Transcript_54975/g.81816  ORF Transcript_54975/g.81816 Transcript_54975/m.81816 type:complete len:80 (-) Transcript_54975:1581-1820(-)
MVCIRMATVDDLIQMQTTNLWCLPENYQRFVVVSLLRRRKTWVYTHQAKKKHNLCMGEIQLFFLKLLLVLFVLLVKYWS